MADIASSEEFLARYEQTFSLLAEAASQEGVARYPLDFREGINLKLEPAATMGALGERASTIGQIISWTPEQLGRRGNGDLTLSTTGRFRDVRPGDCALLLQLATDAVESCRGDYPAVWQQQQAFSKNVETVMRKEAASLLPWERKTLSLLLLPAYRAVFAAAARGVAQHRVTLALLACERYRRERGDYPKRLSDVTPDYLAEVPSDPFTGEPLRLRHDERFIIYSVGQDEKDDGGEVNFTRDLPPDTGLAVPPFHKVMEEEKAGIFPR
jgi:hypothetical protein